MKHTLPAGPRMPQLLQIFHWIRRPFPFLRECSNQFGDWFTLRFPGQRAFVFTQDPIAIKEILAGDPNDLYSGEPNQILKPVVGENSLLLLDGVRHRRSRQLMTPPFHGERMREYGTIMTQVADRIIAKWPTDRTFELHPQMQALTLEIILYAVFGLKEGERYNQLEKKLIEAMNVTASPLGLLFVNRTGKLRMTYLLNALPGFRRRAKRLSEIDELLIAEISERRKEKTPRADILSLLVHSKDEKGQPMTDAELRDQMLTLLVAGHETTATTLCWVFSRILSDERVLEKLETELSQLGNTKTTSPYLDAVIKEAMRIHPVLPIIVRQLKKPMTFNGVKLPEGVVVAPCIYLVHFRKDIWSDPEAFRPERFLEKTPQPYEYFPFGGSVRRCIGAAFATFEMKIVISRILEKVSLQLEPGYSAKVVRRGITLAPSRGLPVRVIANQESRIPRPVVSKKEPQSQEKII